MGKRRKESVSPKAPWLSISMKDMSHARTQIDEYVHVKGESHPLEEVAQYVAFLLLAIESDSVPVPDLAYKLDGDEPEFSITFTKDDRRLVCRFQKPGCFDSERSTMHFEGEEQSWAAIHEEITQQTVGKLRVVDEFRRVVRWLVYNDRGQPDCDDVD